MEAAPLAMEEEHLEITVFLTRHSHLNPHVSQHLQRSLPDLGRSLSQESTSSLAQPRLYNPHMPIHRIFAQEPFGTVHRGKKLRMICIRWQHKPLIPAHSEHPCDVLTVRECFDKVNDNFRLYLCVVIQQNNRLLQCPLPLLSCRRPPFTLFLFRLLLSGRSRSGGFELFGHELIPDGSLFSFQTVTFSSFLFGPHPRFGCLAVKRNIVSAHGIAFTQPPGQPSEPHGTHSILQGHPGHDRRGLIRAQASSGQLWLKNCLGDHVPGGAQLEPSPRLVAISRSALWRRTTPSAIVFCDCTRRPVDRTSPRRRKGHHGYQQPAKPQLNSSDHEVVATCRLSGMSEVGQKVHLRTPAAQRASSFDHLVDAGLVRRGPGLSRF